MTDDNKPRSALLTRSQREYVRGRVQPSNESKMRSRIVKRVYRGLDEDGKILFDMDPELRREVFQEWRNKNYESFHSVGIKLRKSNALPDCWEHLQFNYALEGLLAFIYLGVEETGTGDFWEILEDAIDKAARKRGQHVTDFEYNVKFGNLSTKEDIHDMLKSGKLGFEDLTMREVGALLESDLMEPEDFPEGYLEDIVKTMEWYEENKERLLNSVGSDSDERTD